MKKVLIIIGLILIITGCTKEGDSSRFKREYESLNGTLNSNKQEYREINIDEHNPFVYQTGDDIVKRIENKETFYVYFGSLYCPWCRSVIEKFIEVAKSNNIDKVYYVDIWSSDHVEILRDTYTLDKDSKPILVKKGAPSYSKLLEYLSDVLNDYVLSDKENNSIEVGEKRIFAPNFIYIKDGKAIKLVEGISELQENSRDELTEEILKDEEKKFNEFFKG